MATGTAKTPTGSALSPIQIGPYEITNPAWLAPMAGVTDLPFRKLCRSLGAGLTFSEMTLANRQTRNTPKTLKRLDHRGEPGPIVVQIAGGDPESMVAAAQYSVAKGAQIVDINMGCPAKKVCRKSAGSALLSDPALVRRILSSVVSGVDVPVTLKIRTGPNPNNRNGVLIAKIAQDEGISVLSVHGRSRECAFKGPVEYLTTTEIKQSVSIPVIANGDLDSPEKVKQVLKETGADAFMIGRAAQGRPWIFEQINRYLQTGETLPNPTPKKIGEIIRQHLRELHQFYGEYAGTRIARKHIGWYLEQFPDTRHWRKQLYLADESASQLAILDRFLETEIQLPERPPQ